jgi:hypothetical protein
LAATSAATLATLGPQGLELGLLVIGNFKITLNIGAKGKLKLALAESAAPAKSLAETAAATTLAAALAALATTLGKYEGGAEAQRRDKKDTTLHKWRKRRRFSHVQFYFQDLDILLSMICALLLGLSFVAPAAESITLSNNRIDARLYGGIAECRIGLSIKPNGTDARNMGDLYILQTLQGVEIPKPIRIENWKRSPVVKSVDPAMAAEDFDDSKWSSVEDFDIPENSTVVFRTIFDVSPSLAGSKLVDLSVSPVDDHSVVYLNGIKVGSSDVWDQPNRYSIAGKLKPGKNTLAFVVTNDAGAGGMANKVEVIASPAVDSYRHSFDASTGISTEEFTAAGVKYKREAFASRADDVLVIRFEASKKGAVSIGINFEGADDYQSKPFSKGTIVIWNGTSLGCALLRNDGGTLSDALSGANTATLLVSGVGAQTADMETACRAILDTAAKKSYAELKRRSIAAYRKP